MEFFEEENTAKQIYSVTDLALGLKELIYETYPAIWVRGEISNAKVYASGHAYPSLKDEKSQISCALFRGVLQKIKFDLEEGMSVLARGRMDFYPPRGTCQFIIQQIEPDGIGALQLAFEQLKKKLTQEGLFEESHKKPLPFLPKKVGVVTSLHGAAVHDIYSVLKRRFSNVDIVIYPVAVQGEKAASEIAKAIQYFSKHKACDVLIVGRGGGSLEDLWSFNEEKVVRAIFDCQVPVISAVGHEVDFTLSDFVADVRAPTPSAAAEICMPDKASLIQQIKTLKSQIFNHQNKILQRFWNHLENLKNRFPVRQRIIEDWLQRLGNLQDRLYQAMILKIREQQFLLREFQIRLPNPQGAIEQNANAVEDLKKDLLRGFNIYLKNQQQKLHEFDIQLNLLSPMAVLKRGYVISRNKNGKVMTASKNLNIGDKLDLVYADGVVEVKVDKKQV